ncbi:MAG: RDD family protein [Pseudomonadota bacterium]
MQYARIGVRVVATLIDTTILFVAFYIVAALTGQTTESGFDLTGMPFFLAVAVFFAYYVVLEALSGATVGKLAVRLRVVKEDGSAIGWRESLIRNLLRIVDGFVLYLVGLILVMTSAKRQRLGDRVAETVVVRR